MDEEDRRSRSGALAVMDAGAVRRGEGALGPTPFGLSRDGRRVDELASREVRLLEAGRLCYGEGRDEC